jgi:hypothetical protein
MALSHSHKAIPGHNCILILPLNLQTFVVSDGPAARLIAFCVARNLSSPVCVTTDEVGSLVLRIPGRSLLDPDAASFSGEFLQVCGEQRLRAGRRATLRLTCIKAASSRWPKYDGNPTFERGPLLARIL